MSRVRLQIFPDGGVARLRVHGEATPDPRIVDALGTVDLAAIELGGRVTGCSDGFFGSPNNLLLPGPARSMGEGWETARRRDDGHEHVEIALACEGTIAVAELDTSWYLHNAPGWAALLGPGRRRVARAAAAHPAGARRPQPVRARRRTPVHRRAPGRVPRRRHGPPAPARQAHRARPRRPLREGSVMTVRYSVNCSILFTELPLLERPAAAHAAGFEAVEFWWPFASAAPADAEVEAFARAIEDAGVDLTALNLAAGDMAGGDRGLISWPGRENEVRDSIDIAAALGKRLGTVAFNALYGNRLDGVDPRDQDDVAVQNLGRAAALLPGHGGARAALRDARLPAEDRGRGVRRGGPRAARGAAVRPLPPRRQRRRHRGRDRAPRRPDRARPDRRRTRRGTSPARARVPLRAHLAALDAAGYAGWVGTRVRPVHHQRRAFDWLAGEPHEHHRLHRARHHGRPHGRAPDRRRPRRDRPQPLPSRRRRARGARRPGRHRHRRRRPRGRRRDHDGAGQPGRRGARRAATTGSTPTPSPAPCTSTAPRSAPTSPAGWRRPAPSAASAWSTRR